MSIYPSSRQHGGIRRDVSWPAFLWRQADRILGLALAASEFVLVFSGLRAGRSFFDVNLFPLLLALLVSALVLKAAPREAAPPDIDGTIGLVLSIAAPFFFRPNVFVVADATANILFVFSNMFYFAFIVWGYVSLKRSIAILPGLRAVVSRGPYRIIRHPIYASYLHLAACYAAYFPSLTNLGVTLALGLGILLRVRNEERLLGQSAAYFDLQRNVPRRYTSLLYSAPATVTIGLLIYLQM